MRDARAVGWLYGIIFKHVLNEGLCFLSLNCWDATGMLPETSCSSGFRICVARGGYHLRHQLAVVRWHW